MSDLSLIPIEDLTNAIFDRCDTAVLAHHRTIDSGNPVIFISHTGDSTLHLTLESKSRTFVFGLFRTIARK